MSGFIEQLKLAEKAAEDIYFAKVNRELIDALHNQAQTKQSFMQSADQADAELSRESEGKPVEK